MNMPRLIPVAVVVFSACLPVAAQNPAASDQQFVTKYCQVCHNDRLKTGGLSLQQMDPSQVSRSPETWEKVVRKLRAGMMPPAGMPRPERAVIDTFVSHVESSLDKYAAQHPNPGTVGLHRLNRAEYANAIRDLLALNVDVSTLLPSDDSSEGFDNIADALEVSPALLESYVGAATKISRLAVGDPSITPATNTWRAPGDLSQTSHIEGLPNRHTRRHSVRLHVSARCGIFVQDSNAQRRFRRRLRRAADTDRDHSRWSARRSRQEPYQFSSQSQRGTAYDRRCHARGRCRWRRRRLCRVSR